MKQKVIDIIVPVYGKKEKFVYENLKNMSDKMNDSIRFVIVYKNSKIFNYDLLKTLSDFGHIILEGNDNFQKTDKLLLGLRKSDAKYIITMDSHHSLKIEILNDVANKLKVMEDNLIFMNPIDYDIDSKIEKVENWAWLNAGRYIIKNDFLKKASIDIPYSITYCDDLTFPLFALKELDGDYKFTKLEENFYVKVVGKEISNTAVLRSNKVVDIDISSSLLMILKSLRKYFAKGKSEFDRQYITTFWYYCLRTELTLHKYEELKTKIKQEDVEKYWNNIFINYPEINSFKEITKNIIPYNFTYDPELEIFKNVFK